MRSGWFYGLVNAVGLARLLRPRYVWSKRYGWSWSHYDQNHKRIGYNPKDWERPSTAPPGTGFYFKGVRWDG